MFFFVVVEYENKYSLCSIVIEVFFFGTEVKKIMLGELSNERIKWKMKKL